MKKTLVKIVAFMLGLLLFFCLGGALAEEGTKDEYAWLNDEAYESVDEYAWLNEEPVENAEAESEYDYILLDDGTVEIFSYNGSAVELVVPAELDGHKVSAIGDCAFEGNEAIEKLTLPEGITSIGGNAFYGCFYLYEIALPESLTEIGAWAFADCYFLSEIILPESLTEIGAYAFRGCQSLVEISVPGGVTEIEECAFDSCEALVKVTLSEGVSKIGDSAFGWCDSVSELTLPGSLTEIGEYAFGNCDGLTEVHLPEGVKKLGYEAFGWCDELVEVSLPDSLNAADGNPFAGSIYINRINVSAGHPVFEVVNNVLFNKAEKELVFYFADDYGAGYVETRDYEIPEGTVSIAKDAFYDGCIDKITVPASLIETAGNPFDGCYYLNEIAVSAENDVFEAVDGVLFNKEKKELVSYPCEMGSTSYTIPEGTLSIGESAFCRAAYLEEIIIPESVSKIGDAAFVACYNMAEITIPSGVKKLGTYTFQQCESLIKVNLQEGLIEIEYDAFLMCENLTEITIPSSVTEIDEYAFEMDVLTSIIAQEGSYAAEYAEMCGYTFIAF